MYLLLHVLQDVVLANSKNENALGQLLVLVQYQWPQHEDMLAKIITTIQKRRKFNFPEFFNYVISIFRRTLYFWSRSSTSCSIIP